MVVGGHEGVGIHVANQPLVGAHFVRLGAGGFGYAGYGAGIGVGSAVGEGGGVEAVAADSLEVHVGDGSVVSWSPALVGSQNFTIFGDDGFAVECEVGGTFAEAGAGIDVGAEAAGRLLGDEGAKVVVLADLVGRRREVGYHLRSGHGELAGWRDGHPEVLTHFDANLGAVALIDLVGRDLGGDVGNLHGPRLFGSEWTPPAALVELVVVWHVGFGHEAHVAVAKQGGAVVDGAVASHGEADDEVDAHLAGESGEVLESFFGSVEELEVVEKIATGIGCDTHLWKDCQVHFLAIEFEHFLPDLREVIINVGHSHAWCYGGDTQKSMIHNCGFTIESTKLLKFGHF